MMHDAVLLWALAANQTMEQGFPPNDGLRVTQNIYNKTFMGMTGPVVIDSKGDRLPNYLVSF